MDNPAAKGLLMAIGLIIMVPLMLLGGVVFSDLWRWFVVPLGLMPIGIAHAIGLRGVVSLVTFRISTAELRAQSTLGDGLCRAFGRAIGYLLAWALGAIVVCWM